MNCIIIHGCSSSPENAMDLTTRTYDKHWIPWLRQELIAKGISTKVPLMPTPWAADYNNFKKEFEKYSVDKNSVLVGHSCGCAFLVRWLGETKQEIKKLILVAPWKISKEGDKSEEAFYNYPIDVNIKSRVEKIIIFTSNNEKDDGKKSVKMFHDVLGGKIISLQNKGHYTMNDMGTEEFPELLSEIIS